MRMLTVPVSGHFRGEGDITNFFLKPWISQKVIGKESKSRLKNEYIICLMFTHWQVLYVKKKVIALRGFTFKISYEQNPVARTVCMR